MLREWVTRCLDAKAKRRNRAKWYVDELERRFFQWSASVRRKDIDRMEIIDGARH